MNSYSIYRVDGSNVNFIVFYNSLMACVQTITRDSECSKKCEELLFACYMSELTDYGIVYCCGRKFEITNCEV